MAKARLLSSFTALNLTQFLTALNDNLYKLLLIFLLISIRGPDESSTILSLAGAVFVIPFLIFAAPAGIVADRFSKQRIIILTRLFEIAVVSLAIVAFAMESALFGYIVLFLMATLSTFFSPCKYGILPEIVKREKLSHYNGVVTATTYLAIIVGTFLASFLADLTKKNYFLCAWVPLAIAITSFFCSLKIEKTAPQAPEKRASTRIFREIFKTFHRARKIRYLVAALIFGSYFLFVGSFVQLNIIPFSLQSLGQSEIMGGYLFLLTAIGIGLGSFFAGKLSGKEIELAFVPLSAIAMGFVFIGLYSFDEHLLIVALLLALVGFLGGFYIVPTDAFIQAASPGQDRGQNVATANFFSFIGVIFASGLLALFGNVLSLSAASGFLTIGIITIFVAAFLTLLLADQLLRFIIARLLAPFWRLKIVGKNHLVQGRPSLLIANRTSWIDTIIAMAALPRLIRYVVPKKPEFRKRLLYKILQIIPIDIEQPYRLTSSAVKVIEGELSFGHSVCLMLPDSLGKSSRRDWQEHVLEIESQFRIPLIAVHITRGKSRARGLKAIRALFDTAIVLSFSPAKTLHLEE